MGWIKLIITEAGIAKSLDEFLGSAFEVFIGACKVFFFEIPNGSLDLALRMPEPGIAVFFLGSPGDTPILLAEVGSPCWFFRGSILLERSIRNYKLPLNFDLDINTRW